MIGALRRGAVLCHLLIADLFRCRHRCIFRRAGIPLRCGIRRGILRLVRGLLARHRVEDPHGLDGLLRLNGAAFYEAPHDGDLVLDGRLRLLRGFLRLGGPLLAVCLCGPAGRLHGQLRLDGVILRADFGKQVVHLPLRRGVRCGKAVRMVLSAVLLESLCQIVEVVNVFEVFALCLLRRRALGFSAERRGERPTEEADRRLEEHILRKLLSRNSNVLIAVAISGSFCIFVRSAHAAGEGDVAQSAQHILRNGAVAETELVQQGPAVADRALGRRTADANACRAADCQPRARDGIVVFPLRLPVVVRHRAAGGYAERRRPQPGQTRVCAHDARKVHADLEGVDADLSGRPQPFLCRLDVLCRLGALRVGDPFEQVDARAVAARDLLVCLGVWVHFVGVRGDARLLLRVAVFLVHFLRGRHERREEAGGVCTEVLRRRAHRRTDTLCRVLVAHDALRDLLAALMLASALRRQGGRGIAFLLLQVELFGVVVRLLHRGEFAEIFPRVPIVLQDFLVVLAVVWRTVPVPHGRQQHLLPVDVVARAVNR